MKLKHKIMALPMAAVLLVAVLLVAGLLHVEEDIEHIVKEHENGVAEQTLRLAIDQTVFDALARAEIIAGNSEIQRAVAMRDTATIERLMADSFDHLRDSTGMVQLQFHTPPATSLIRLHNLQKRGDDLSAFRKTVVDANTSQKSLMGLERGRAGLGARGVAAISFAGNHVGTVEVGLDISGEYLAALSERVGRQFEFYPISAGVADEQSEMVGRAAATFDGDPILTAEQVELATQGKLEDLHAEINGEDHFLRAIPITDYAGDVAGVFTVSTPNSIVAEIVHHAEETTLLVLGVALAIAAAAAYYFANKIGHALSGIVSATQRLSEGDTSTEIAHTDQSDEVGQMARALETFRDGMIEREELARTVKIEEERAAEQREAQHKAEAEAERRQIEAEKRAEQEKRAREAEIAEQEKRRLAEEQAAAEARLADQRRVVSTLAEALSELAEGNLTHRIEEKLPGEYEHLRESYNAAVHKLARVVGATAIQAEEINAEISGLEASNRDLTNRAENNAATLEEAAAALEEMTASIKSASEAANQARDIALEARHSAEAGGKDIDRVIEAMRRIEKSSANITAVVELIEMLSFQTNLLALNAGVEAARAGDAGRGFAVVASEVRALAMRSSEAAKEISDLVAQSATDVGSGVKMVDEAGESLMKIVRSVVQIADHVEGISTSSSEQAIGLHEISSAVGQLDQTTQANVAVFEQTSVAASKLAEKCGELARNTAQFHFDRNDTSISDAQHVEPNDSADTDERRFG